MGMRDSTREIVRPGLLLGAVGLGAAVLLVSVHLLTRDRIELQRDRQSVATLQQVLPESGYDNDPLRDFTEVSIAGLSGSSRVYRARKNGQPVAAVYEITAPDGYSGPIELLVGLDRAGRVLGVRVIGHRETPGLGDPIEVRRSDWILQFDGRSLESPPPEDWAASRRGGAFDTITGATLTSQAVVLAVRRALEHFESDGDAVFDGP